MSWRKHMLPFTLPGLCNRKKLPSGWELAEDQTGKKMWENILKSKKQNKNAYCSEITPHRSEVASAFMALKTEATIMGAHFW